MPKKPVYILLLILLSLSYSCRTSRKLTTSSERHPSVTPVGQLADDYIRNYKDIAISEMKRTGIPASITLAQGMVESDYGRSSLARRANNHFGIKCHDDWKGPVVNENDDSDNECFRKYSSAENSFYDHSDFLKTRPRYNFLFDIATSDYKAWAYGLKKSGYATNPDYANMIIKSIEDNNLMVFDIPGKNGKTTDSGKKHQSQGTLTAGTQVSASTRKPSPLPVASTSTANDTTSANTIKSVPPVQINNTVPAQLPSAAVSTNVLVYAKAPRIKENNKVQYILVKDGETRESIEKEFQLLRWELPKYNELSSDFTLVPGQILYLHPKRDKAEPGKEYYIAAEGDTMYKISQEYGVKMKNLYSMNRMAEGKEAAAGTKIYLRGTKPAN